MSIRKSKLNVPQGDADNAIISSSATSSLLPPSSSSLATTGKRQRPARPLGYYFDNTPLVKAIVIYTISSSFGFLISVLTGSHVHLDLIGCGAFALAAIINFKSKLQRVQLSSYATALWGIKLSVFLCFRAIQTGHDERLTEMLLTMEGMVTFWFVSWVWQIVCSLPHILGTTSKLSGNSWALNIGTVVYGIGIAIETAADLQKFSFKLHNPKRFCNVGLWSLSQHPNYFGNLVLWVGILIMNAPALIEPQPTKRSSKEGVGIMITVWRYSRLILSFASPIFMWYLFEGQASGSISNTAELAKSKYGLDADWYLYITTTPLIIPKLF